MRGIRLVLGRGRLLFGFGRPGESEGLQLLLERGRRRGCSCCSRCQFVGGAKLGWVWFHGRHHL